MAGMKLKSVYNGYCKAWLYYDGEHYVLKAGKQDMVKYNRSLFKFLGENVGKLKSFFLIRESSEVVVNGYEPMIKQIPTDFRIYNLVIIKTR